MQRKQNRKPRTIFVNQHTKPPRFGVKVGNRIMGYRAKLKFEGGLEWWVIDRASFAGEYSPNALWTPANHGIVNINSGTHVCGGLDFYLGAL